MSNYGPHWRYIREWVLLRHPWCRLCGHVPSTEADHIIPRRSGGSDAQENLEGVCKPCHSSKTASRDGGYGNPVLSPGAQP
jgi:5-methylcytosine-specific restriction protein A